MLSIFTMKLFFLFLLKYQKTKQKIINNEKLCVKSSLIVLTTPFCPLHSCSIIDSQQFKDFFLFFDFFLRSRVQLKIIVVDKKKGKTFSSMTSENENSDAKISLTQLTRSRLTDCTIELSAYSKLIFFLN